MSAAEGGQFCPSLNVLSNLCITTMLTAQTHSYASNNMDITWCINHSPKGHGDSKAMPSTHNTG